MMRLDVGVEHRTTATELVLEQQAGRFGRVPILKKDQLDELVGGAGSALKLRMEVTDVALDIEAEQATLKVRFGFSQLQLEDK